jgi:hypothetical protein
MATAKIVSVEKGDRDYVWLSIEVDVDGVKTMTKYPFDFKNYIGKTEQEFLDWIDINVNYICDRFIEAEFRKKFNADEVAKKINGLLINREYERENVELVTDKGVSIIALSDGTFTQKV